MNRDFRRSKRLAKKRRIDYMSIENNNKSEIDVFEPLKTTMTLNKLEAHENHPMDMDMDKNYTKAFELPKIANTLNDKVDRICDMIQLPFNYPKLYNLYNLERTHAVLLHGPPGTGKSKTVEEITKKCNRLYNIDITLMRVNCTDILSKWMGESEAHLKNKFEEARKNTYTIMFFDEIDALVPIRDKKSNTNYSGILSTFLTLFDATKDTKHKDNKNNIFIIGATNKLNHIDSALIRSGRFKLIKYEYMNIDEIKTAIKIYTRTWINISTVKDANMWEDFINDVSIMFRTYHEISGAFIRDICSTVGIQMVKYFTSSDILMNDKVERIKVSSDVINALSKLFKSCIKNTIAQRTKNIKCHDVNRCGYIVDKISHALCKDIDDWWNNNKLYGNVLIILRHSMISVSPLHNSYNAIPHLIATTSIDIFKEYMYENHGFKIETINMNEYMSNNLVSFYYSNIKDVR